MTLCQVLIENKSKFILVHASSGHKRAVEDILSQPAVQARLADTKASEEIRALGTFFDMLKKDPERAYYGYNVSFVFVFACYGVMGYSAATTTWESLPLVMSDLPCYTACSFVSCRVCKRYLSLGCHLGVSFGEKKS